MTIPAPRACDLCGATAFRSLSFYYQWEGQRLQGTECRACSLIFLDPLPTPEQLERLYGKAYFTDRLNYNREERDRKFIEESEAIDLTKIRTDKFTDYIVARYPNRAFRYLEVGCGPGYTLKSLESQGWEAHGLEISEHAADFARRHLHLPVVTGNIETTESFRDNQFDLVYMGDVIEHLRSPSATVAKFARLLEPGGLLVLALPSALNLPALRLGMQAYRALGRQRKMDILPYHLYEFTPRTIRALLEKHGFKVVELQNSVKKPSQIRLGGNPVEQVSKLIGQYPTYYLNRLTGGFGDRIFVTAQNAKSA